MSAHSSSANERRARAWLLHAQFHVAEHTRLANSDTNQIFPEYIREFFNARASYLNKHLKSLNLISVSVPTTLSSPETLDGYRDVVNVHGIFHGSHLVSERALQGIFGSSAGVTTSWDALYCGQGEACPSLDDHAVFKTFLRESSLGGMDTTLRY